MHISSALFFRAYIVSLFLQFHINKENEKEYVEKNVTYSYVYRYLTNYDNEIYYNITSDEKDSFLDYLHKKHKVYFL